MSEMLTTLYTIKGRNFPLLLEFTYDLDGYLVCFKNISEPLSEKTQMWLFSYQRFPYTENMIQSWKSIKNLEIIVGKPEISFEVFYKLYQHKVGKLEAERAWKRLNKADQLKAITKINAYNGFLKRKQIAKVYPATYLNKRRFDDEFNSIH